MLKINSILALATGACADVLRPSDASGKPVVIALAGRRDVDPEMYGGLVEACQKAAAGKGMALYVVRDKSFDALAGDLAALRGELSGPPVFYAGHGMKDGSGAEAAQAALEDTTGAQGVVFFAGFLERLRRPGAAACAAKWEVQPTHDCPKGVGLPLCPGGYLPDGEHACDAKKGAPGPDYALPTLSIGGELDGIVRVARLAEAWYTQKEVDRHEVALVEGMNHGDLLSGMTPDHIAANDLPSDIGQDEAQKRVAKLVTAFLNKPGSSSPPSTDAFFKPFADMFVGQEGSWWWTGQSDEQGSSAWAAEAQRLMAAPVPKGFDNWQVANEFHMLSDEDKIPPYYRGKHRAEIDVDGNNVIHSSSVTQLRYMELSVKDTAVGTNGFAIIKEETCAVLNNVADDGHEYVSAIEIATKLVSRQLVYNRTGNDAPVSLDDGDRCKVINQAAYDLAMQSASKAARDRFQKIGRPLVMTADVKPSPPAGPWWIWNYLQYNDKGDDGVEVASYYAFYSLDSDPYGAGNHYCKLLSPARALEWIYTDGLRPSADISCCSKKGLLLCGLTGRPTQVKIGKDSFCCPKGATSDKPCPSEIII